MRYSFTDKDGVYSFTDKDGVLYEIDIPGSEKPTIIGILHYHGKHRQYVNVWVDDGEVMWKDACLFLPEDARSFIECLVKLPAFS